MRVFLREGDVTACAGKYLRTGVFLRIGHVTAHSFGKLPEACRHDKEYKGDAGFRDVSVDVSSRFAVTEHWGVGGSVLLGSMADSPIVEDRGEALSGHGGLFLWYKF